PLQLVPLRTQRVTCERCAWRIAFIEHLPAGTFDPHTVGREVASRVLRQIRHQRRDGPMCFDVHGCTGQPLGKALEAVERTLAGPTEIERAYVAPAIQTAVCLQCLIEKLEHGATVAAPLPGRHLIYRSRGPADFCR